MGKQTHIQTIETMIWLLRLRTVGLTATALTEVFPLGVQDLADLRDGRDAEAPLLHRGPSLPPMTAISMAF